MTDDERERDDKPDTRSSRWFRREAIILAVALAIGFVLVPAMIYEVGIQVFGPTEDSASLSGFYGRFLEALMKSDPIVWSLNARSRSRNSCNLATVRVPFSPLERFA